MRRLRKAAARISQRGGTASCIRTKTSLVSTAIWLPLSRAQRTTAQRVKIRGHIFGVPFHSKGISRAHGGSEPPNNNNNNNTTNVVTAITEIYLHHEHCQALDVVQRHGASCTCSQHPKIQHHFSRCCKYVAGHVRTPARYCWVRVPIKLSAALDRNIVKYAIH